MLTTKEDHGYGSSYFVDPRGEIIAQAGEDKDELLVADMYLSRIEKNARAVALPPPSAAAGGRGAGAELVRCAAHCELASAKDSLVAASD